ncbi:tetraacyldisaccharide 4'-kinase [Campylobacter fetus]|uniref:tetraacyldisaccharide 4'-kinase n=1 Tax=Campylobacter fetus TaxID=196 RepID=UPI0003C25D96|nr:tetraacyldisaccharide 4'-kinase [Campylobacter fetus]AGZ81918.1 tetraacyldisaccharide 4'-kinase [Campylobacter fetus subsp. testudinum 03-427]ALV65085.1 tetraacyldisaccharide 4'-kinase [Campylobacter fetus subsp. testudinum Sp3]AVK81359.1 tetraacyldisaccharide 4'-kinase [Campylobacter fetus subsp. testudinum]EAI4321788.1 tetraacyldisaccharide 4'-kinase [Campylobacter fetus]EAI4390828.1 tetraacyldisaccharide 4'-kinase [Campylobacter fetus]
MFERKLHSWINRYFYRPRYLETLISMVLSPLALIYYVLVVIKFKLSKQIKFDIPIISIGNLIVGGTGKTPLTKAIFNQYNTKFRTFIISRGYKRSSKGMLKVCIDGEILCSVDESGDEAMEYALSLKNANIIVSENRKLAINEAIKCGAELVLLDDGFGKFDIFKFNIILKPAIEPVFNLVLPSGAYRYPKSFYNFADFIPTKDDIISSNHIINKTTNMVLVTAIANPLRLKNIFDNCLGVELFEDHHKFTKSEIENIFKKWNTTTILVTQKDYVKIRDFGFNVSILELHTEISSQFKLKLDEFIDNYKQNMIK